MLFVFCKANICCSVWDDGMFTILLKQFSAMTESDGFSWLTIDGLVTPGMWCGSGNVTLLLLK